MIKRNEAAKRAGEMGIEYDMSNITASKPVKYHSTAGNDKAVPQGTNIETTVKDAEGDVSLSGIEQRHMLMQRLSRAPQESFLCLRKRKITENFQFFSKNSKARFPGKSRGNHCINLYMFLCFEFNPGNRAR